MAKPETPKSLDRRAAILAAATAAVESDPVLSIGSLPLTDVAKASKASLSTLGKADALWSEVWQYARTEGPVAWLRNLQGMDGPNGADQSRQGLLGTVACLADGPVDDEWLTNTARQQDLPEQVARQLAVEAVGTLAVERTDRSAKLSALLTRHHQRANVVALISELKLTSTGTTKLATDARWERRRVAKKLTTLAMSDPISAASALEFAPFDHKIDRDLAQRIVGLSLARSAKTVDELVTELLPPIVMSRSGNLVDVTETEV